MPTLDDAPITPKLLGGEDLTAAAATDEKNISKEDLEHEVRALEHKLLHYETKSSKYHELVDRLTDARNRLHALDV